MSYVGFVGFSGGKFDETKAKKIIDEIFSKLEQDDAVVSGATNIGINKLVYEKAKSLDMKTIGIMCKEGYDNDVFPVDQLIVIGDHWGDESKEFLSSIEILYRIGGGKQSLAETKEAKKMGIEVYEYELEELKG